LPAFPGHSFRTTDSASGCRSARSISINQSWFVLLCLLPSSKGLAQRCHAMPPSAASWFGISVPDLVLNSLSTTARSCTLYTVTNSAVTLFPILGTRQPMSHAKWPRKQKRTNDSS
jgi:hypothetical protein